jgi:adenylate cyclase
MRIRWSYQGNENIFDRPAEAVVLGRPRQGVPIDIDLTPDLRVSRPHARIWLADGQHWVEDLGSANGTELDGRPIQGLGRVRFEPGQTIRISDTTLTVENLAAATAAEPGSADGEITHLGGGGPRLEIIDVVDAAAPVFVPSQPIDPGGAEALALLYELPLQFGAQEGLDRLLQTIIERLVELIPAASRGALLLEDKASGELLLKAHVPAGEPAVDMSLAARTMARREGFIWRERLAPGRGQFTNRLRTGMYAPLIFQGQVVGVTCVDNADRGGGFAAADLRLMLAIGRYAAMATVQKQLQSELSRKTVLLSRLLTNFSPKLRELLLSQAARGRLRLGGEKSEVVMLESDIRGFTRLTTGMDSDDVMDLLNDYFSPLVDAVFQHDGVVDKISGDSVYAVFGSPEPDPLRHEKAIQAALTMQQAIAEVSETRRRRGQPTCTIGIGIHSGEVLHGFIGSKERLQLTLVGDAANWTSRYCAGAAGGEILISPAFHERLWRRIDAESVTIDTKHEGPLSAYRLRGMRSGPI